MSSLAHKPGSERTLVSDQQAIITSDDSDTEGAQKEIAHSVLRLSSLPRQIGATKTETGNQAWKKGKTCALLNSHLKAQKQTGKGLSRKASFYSSVSEVTISQ